MEILKKLSTIEKHRSESHEIDNCRQQLKGFIDLVQSKFSAADWELKDLLYEKEQLIEMLQKAQTVRSQETIQHKLLKVRKDLKVAYAKREESVITVIKSVDTTIGVASESLEDSKFDLWTRLYGFVVTGVQKAMYKLDYAAQEVMKILKSDGAQS